METLNKVILIGSLTHDVELRRLPSGSAVANLRLAVNETFTDRSGERRETTVFIDAEVWGHQAETCSEHLCKGRQVLVEGRLKLDQWQDKEGNSRSRLLVHASRVTFLDSPRDVGEPPAEKKDPGYPAEWDDIEVPPFG